MPVGIANVNLFDTVWALLRSVGDRDVAFRKLGQRFIDVRNLERKMVAARDAFDLPISPARLSRQRTVHGCVNLDAADGEPGSRKTERWPRDFLQSERVNVELASRVEVRDDERDVVEGFGLEWHLFLDS